MISFQKVTKQFGETKAIDSITFDIDAGEFVFIIGPSGAGKTTLRRLLIKELEATTGTIQVGDFILNQMKKKDVPVLRQQIGTVFQDYQLLPDRTAAENIALALEITGKSDTSIEKTIPSLLKLIGLETKGHLFPSQLSGGEAQRVVISRALATDPAVLFADEPTGNLDRDNTLQIVELLKKVHDHGTTVIMATHDLTLLEQVKARVITMENGRLSSDTGEVIKPSNTTTKDNQKDKPETSTVSKSTNKESETAA